MSKSQPNIGKPAEGDERMSTTIEFRELPARLGEALALVAAGCEVILTDGATPRARLVPCADPNRRVPGLHAGAFQAAADFDAPLPDDFWAASQPAN
jgi:antitoxin (DNA-binding transcriptional repressor) of toxin-antitoxin stability system